MTQPDTIKAYTSLPQASSWQARQQSIFGGLTGFLDRHALCKKRKVLATTIYAIHPIKGYTLVELLIVMLIIGIVTGVALLRMGHGQHQKTAFFVDELVATLRYSEEQALFHTKPTGFLLGEHAYQFADLQDTSTQGATWVLSRDPQLSAHHIPDELQIVVKTQGVHVDLSPRLQLHPVVTFSEDGEMTPFVIDVNNQKEKVHYVITGDANGTIESQRTYLN